MSSDDSGRRLIDARGPATAEGPVDPWAWVDDDSEAGIDVSGHEVTAILVAHHGAEWLPAALTGLRALTVAPDRLIAVDAGSGDDSGALLEAAHRDGLVTTVISDPAGEPQSWATSIQHALAAAGPSRENEWVWLLHDDAVPAPDALQVLLGVAVGQDAAIVGPKLMHPPRRHQPPRVSELGVAVSATGRREVHVAPGDIDQGQYDGRSEVLGLSTCGMLLRRTVLTELEGFSMALTHREGVEFCWRARLSGHRVLVAPAAAVAHRQVGLAGLRPGSRHAAAEDRAAGMSLAAVYTAALLRPLAPLGLVLAAVLRALGYLIGKAPDRAADELGAIRRFISTGATRRQLRAAVRRLEPDPEARRRIRALRPGPADSLRRAVDAAGASWAERRIDSGAAEATIDELTGDDFAGRGFDPRRPWRSAYAVGVGITVLLALIAGRSLLGPGHLVSATLLPAPDGVGALWAQWLRPLADGSSAPPWLGLTALGSTFTLGQPEWLITLLILMGVPLAMVAVHPLLRRVLGDRRIRVWVGVMYGVLPVLLGGTNQGRLVLAVLALVLPAFALAALALVRPARHGAEGWRAAAAAGLAATVVVAFQPVLALLLVLGAVAATLVLRGVDRLRPWVMVVVPLIALAPWWPDLLRHPGRALLGPDPMLEPGPVPGAGELLLGRLGPEGLPPWWVSALTIGVIWVLALAGLVLRPRDRRVITGWAVALLALDLAGVLAPLVLSAPPLDTPVRPWVGGVVFLALASALVAAGVGLDGVGVALAHRSFSALQPLTAAGGVVVSVIAVLALGWWGIAGAMGPSVARSGMDELPSYLRSAMAERPGSAVLAIRLADEPAFSLVTGHQVRLGDAERGYGYRTSERVLQTESVVRRLSAGTADATLADDLAALGVTHLWIEGADADITTTISSTPGLRVGAGTLSGRAWVVEPTPTLVPPPTIPTTRVVGATLQGVWLLLVGFLAAPSLRRERSRDPAMTARRAAVNEGAPR